MLARSALFLDRDGVINIEKNYLYRIEDFEFIDGIFDLCRFFGDHDFLIFIVTNQSGICRGFYSEEDFLKLTEWMEAEFSKRGITIAKTYHCPHHPDFTGACSCRKPEPGMLLQAQEEFGIDLASSVLVGDKPSDIEAAWKAGVGRAFLLDATKGYATHQAILQACQKAFQENFLTTLPSFLNKSERFLQGYKEALRYSFFLYLKLASTQEQKDAFVWLEIPKKIAIYLENMNYLLNLPKKERYDKATRYAIGEIEGEEIYMTEFLMAKELGYIQKFHGHRELGEYLRLISFLLCYKIFDDRFENLDNSRTIFSIEENDRKIFHIIDKENFLVSVFVISKVNFTKQLNRRFYHTASLSGGTATPHILSPARPFWRHSDLLLQVYQNFKNTAIAQEDFLPYLEEIKNASTQMERQKSIEAIDALVKALYNAKDKKGK